MEICFYNFFHIGDTYFSSMFINLICSSNSNVNFYYYFINGHCFFENIPNIKSIQGPEENYSGTLINGHPPENLLNTKYLKLLHQNNMQWTGDKIITVEGKNVLFINTWCISDNLKHGDYHISSALNSYQNLIKTINSKYNLSLEFKINTPIELIRHITHFDCRDWDANKYNECDYTNTIFIFNFVPRSLGINMGNLNDVISQLRKSNNIILSCYNSLFDNNSNIKFVDKDYNIRMTPSCRNLIYMWDIASKCKNIVVLPTGSSWCFLHKLDVLRDNQIQMFGSDDCCNKLNGNVNFLLGENKNLIKSFGLI